MLAAADRAVAGVWYRMPVVSGMRVDATYQQTATCLVRIYGVD
jgi:hypothetical protein